MSDLTAKQINVAVEYWSNLLTGEEPSIIEQNDNAKLDLDIPLLFMLDTMHTEKKIEGNIEAFKESLSESLMSGEYVRHIGVDYHPCRELSKALKDGGFKESMTTFPRKTNMSFYDGKVTVQEGYGSSAVTLYDPKNE